MEGSPISLSKLVYLIEDEDDGPDEEDDHVADESLPG